MDLWGKKFWATFQVSTFNLDEEYQEKYIKTYKKLYTIIGKAPILNCKEIKALKNIDTKCYFGRGSYPGFINSWQVKTDALLYDTLIFDINTFRNMVIGILPPDLEDDKILDLMNPVDLEASNFLMDLYKGGCIKLVSSPSIWNNLFGSDIHKSLIKENKLYTDKKEIVEISKNAALFPGDEYNYPGLLQLMNEDILTSYLTNSSIITQEYSGYIKRKLSEFNQIKYKNNIIDCLLEYEVPNFDSLTFNNISKIRKLKSISKFRNKIENSSQNICENSSNIKEIIQEFRDELWKLALDNIEDNKTKIIVESLISNLPVLSWLFTAKDFLKVNELHNHWGYTILQLKKNTTSSIENKENLNSHGNLMYFDQEDISLKFDDYLYISSVYYNRWEYEEALGAINNALKLRPENHAALSSKSVILSKLKQNYEALKIVDNLLEIYPDSFQDWLNKGTILGDIGQYEEALIAYKKSIETNPKYTLAWFNAGNLLASNLGKYLEAIEYFDMAIKIEPNFDIAWDCKGSAYGDLNKHDEAIKCFDKAISINPNNPSAWSNKGSALCNIGKWEEGLEAYVHSLALGPYNGFVWYLIGNVYKALNEDEKALEAYNEAVELDSSLSTIISKSKDSLFR